jgi:hypothetical protein
LRRHKNSAPKSRDLELSVRNKCRGLEEAGVYEKKRRRRRRNKEGRGFGLQPVHIWPHGK